VSHPLLKGAEATPRRRGDPRAEGVPEIMEADDTDAGPPAGSLEALAYVRAVERLPGLRVSEDEIVVVGERRTKAQLRERLRERRGHGDAAYSTERLR